MTVLASSRTLLWERDATSTDDSGCVVCTDTPECPTCDDNEQCLMTTQTCTECPQTYCAADDSDTDSSSLSSAQVGGIAGGLSGFVFILLLVGAYFLFRKYRNKLLLDYDLGIDEEMKELTGLNDEGDLDYANQRRYRGSRYPGDAEKRMSSATISTMTNSVFTKASNVLNIVYIPGVTSSRPARSIAPNRRNTRRPTNSMYSKGMSVYSKETYFSDLENASFHGGNIATKAGHPTLVEINRDDYNYDEDDDDEDGYFEGEENYPINIDMQLPAIPQRRQLNDDIMEEEEEEEEEEEQDDRALGNKDMGYESEVDENQKKSNHSDHISADRIGADSDSNSDSEDGEDIQLDIGLSSHNDSLPRVIPTRYASIMEKREKTNQPREDPFMPRRDSQEGQEHEYTESYSESSSDSDEENIEMLIHQSQNRGHNHTRENPFSSPLDHP